MKPLTLFFNQFFKSEKAGGIIIILSTMFSLWISNSSFGENYLNFWQVQFAHHSLQHWINDGLMAIFFLLIGLELEREIYIGELSDFKSASFPLFAALGGMIVPACIYLFINRGTAYTNGFGIPMATDIAFALAVLSLLGNRIPNSLKVLLTALAVIDDLGAILVIAFFYSSSIFWINLAGVAGIWVFLFILNRKKVNHYLPYIIGGISMWYLMLNSGVHATLAGVITAFVIPFDKQNKENISYKIQEKLHIPVAYFILPLFALANTAIVFHFGNIGTTYCIGIIAGLLLGKPLGILLFTYIASKLNWTQLPQDANWLEITCISLMASIGFTMSIFITLIAFDSPALINASKLAILLASFGAGLLSYFCSMIVFKDSKPSSRKN